MFIRKINVFYSAVISLFIFFGSSQLIASTKLKDAPLKIEGTTKVSAEDIFTLIEDVPDLLLIDARMRSDRTQGFIEGSISLPDIETNCNRLQKIAPKKSSPVLFYCNGVKCGRSGKSSKIAVNCGYKNIYWFRGGFNEWKSKNLPYIKSNK